ncbi:hypothetical protein BDZ91DRAFT_725252 [Kalaharituber pfeilii]|nr:hypothetical protein BDZ91DRAFT_725252 [Kalaharituber pfeilii]
MRAYSQEQGLASVQEHKKRTAKRDLKGKGKARAEIKPAAPDEDAYGLLRPGIDSTAIDYASAIAPAPSMSLDLQPAERPEAPVTRKPGLITTLPTEILTQILSIPTIYVQASKLSLVCKRWHAILTPMIYNRVEFGESLEDLQASKAEFDRNVARRRAERKKRQEEAAVKREAANVATGPKAVQGATGTPNDSSIQEALMNELSESESDCSCNGLLQNLPPRAGNAVLAIMPFSIGILRALCQPHIAKHTRLLVYRGATQWSFPNRDTLNIYQGADLTELIRQRRAALQILVQLARKAVRNLGNLETLLIHAGDPKIANAILGALKWSPKLKSLRMECMNLRELQFVRGKGSEAHSPVNVLRQGPVVPFYEDAEYNPNKEPRSLLDDSWNVGESSKQPLKEGEWLIDLTPLDENVGYNPHKGKGKEPQSSLHDIGEVGESSKQRPKEVEWLTDLTPDNPNNSDNSTSISNKPTPIIPQVAIGEFGKSSKKPLKKVGLLIDLIPDSSKPVPTIPHVANGRNPIRVRFHSDTISNAFTYAIENLQIHNCGYHLTREKHTRKVNRKGIVQVAEEEELKASASLIPLLRRCRKLKILKIEGSHMEPEAVLGSWFVPKFAPVSRAEEDEAEEEASKPETESQSKPEEDGEGPMADGDTLVGSSRQELQEAVTGSANPGNSAAQAVAMPVHNDEDTSNTAETTNNDTAEYGNSADDNDSSTNRQYLTFPELESLTIRRCGFFRSFETPPTWISSPGYEKFFLRHKIKKLGWSGWILSRHLRLNNPAFLRVARHLGETLTILNVVHNYDDAKLIIHPAEAHGIKFRHDRLLALLSHLKQLKALELKLSRIKVSQLLDVARTIKSFNIRKLRVTNVYGQIGVEDTQTLLECLPKVKQLVIKALVYPQDEITRHVYTQEEQEEEGDSEADGPEQGNGNAAPGQATGGDELLLPPSPPPQPTGANGLVPPPPGPAAIGAAPNNATLQLTLLPFVNSIPISSPTPPPSSSRGAPEPKDPFASVSHLAQAFSNLPDLTRLVYPYIFPLTPVLLASNVRAWASSHAENDDIMNLRDLGSLLVRHIPQLPRGSHTRRRLRQPRGVPSQELYGIAKAELMYALRTTAEAFADVGVRSVTVGYFGTEKWEVIPIWFIHEGAAVANNRLRKRTGNTGDEDDDGDGEGEGEGEGEEEVLAAWEIERARRKRATAWYVETYALPVAVQDWLVDVLQSKGLPWDGKRKLEGGKTKKGVEYGKFGIGGRPGVAGEYAVWATL